jgi:hypothetical protein
VLAASSRVRAVSASSRSNPGRAIGSRLCGRVANILAGVALVSAAGCQHLVNPWAEDGPSRGVALDSATGMDVRERYSPSTRTGREWEPREALMTSGDIHHWELLFADLFEDVPEHDQNYRVAAVDYVAMAASPTLFVGNLIAVPFSAALPPWVLASDGHTNHWAGKICGGECRCPVCEPMGDESARPHTP